MGANRSKVWYDENQRKILILSFSEEYSNALSEFLIKKPLQIDEKVGFKLEKVPYDELTLGYWFVTFKNRNLWRHHYYGTQGVILVFSHSEVEFANKLIIEALNIFNDVNLKNVPFLVLFDKNKENIEYSIEEFRKKLISMPNVLYNTQFIDFRESGISMINCGIDWLVEVMKAIM